MVLNRSPERGGLILIRNTTDRTLGTEIRQEGIRCAGRLVLAGVRELNRLLESILFSEWVRLLGSGKVLGGVPIQKILPELWGHVFYPLAGPVAVRESRGGQLSPPGQVAPAVRSFRRGQNLLSREATLAPAFPCVNPERYGIARTLESRDKSQATSNHRHQ